MNQNPSLKAAIVQNFTAIFLAICWIVSLIVVMHILHFSSAKDELFWAEGMSSGWITAIGVALKTNSPHTVDPSTTATSTQTVTVDKVTSIPPVIPNELQS